MSDAVPGTRRKRLRADTLAEIKKHGLDQVAAHGPEQLSLNAIARTMHMSGPAIYRYFASRDDLLATLASESCHDLADTLHAAAQPAGDPRSRLFTVVRAYRSWATLNPNRFRLVFSSRYGSGPPAAGSVIPAADRSTSILIGLIADLLTSGDGVTPQIRQLAILTWTRLHGIVSLEIEGRLQPMAIDAEILLEAEVHHIIEQASR